MANMIPQPIGKLSEQLINRIAAGEVIQRPVNLVKELLENSLDAGASFIRITINGLKVLQVEDNGCGIEKVDLKMACQRFSTSKLKHFEDLANMQTFGFRGEALASISHVARVSITSKTESSPVGYQLSYKDGEPATSAPRPIARSRGTVIRVEDLFYNVPIRKEALRNEREEYALIVDLVSKYAIDNSAGVGFCLRKSVNDHDDLVSSADTQGVDNIRAIYGQTVADSLVPFRLNQEGNLKFSVLGFMSDLTLLAKKTRFVLFINKRLVDCASLKKSIESVYSSHLGKGNHPFVYLSVQINPQDIDVNVHPTKNEVNFLHEEDIVKLISENMSDKLTSLRSSRSMGSMPQVHTSPNDPSANKTKVSSSPGPSKCVRTDPKDRKIDELFNSQRNSAIIGKNSGRRIIKLTSVLRLKEELELNSDKSLHLILSNSSFIGCLDWSRCFIQHETQLLLIDLEKLSQDLFNQIFLEDFGNFGEIELSPSLAIMDLLKIYFETGNVSSGEEVEDEIETVCRLLESHREMLNDYFSINIDSRGLLVCVPIMLDGHIPDWGRLPSFLFELAHAVNCKREIECFRSIGRVISRFYGCSAPDFRDEAEEEFALYAKNVELVIYPKIKKLLKPGKDCADSCRLMETSVAHMYKVFERC